MKYRIQLDTVTQQFIAIDVHDQQHQGMGRTIEQAVAQLER
ncbi:hypothetical protein ACFQ5J_03685 [Lacticaseibacillus baoqingensis]|uniref:Uncharacterized protein n=1 Tax=Lacticaseibacillus baoqingensis TaxID=2486013 RepID=A0ABW4E4M4_9LACO|nr:hypothetical protein [Lacticaseibacillus baoqingensis]